MVRKLRKEMILMATLRNNALMTALTKKTKMVILLKLNRFRLNSKTAKVTQSPVSALLNSSTSIGCIKLGKTLKTT